MRIGIGYDVHKLTENRKLIIGGVEIPFEKGLLGHSDADVLLHAITDALFGAAALGDIGSHFPDTDEKYKGANSLKLLAECVKILKEKQSKEESSDFVGHGSKITFNVTESLKREIKSKNERDLRCC